MDTTGLTGFTRAVPSPLSVTVFVLLVFVMAGLWLAAVGTDHSTVGSGKLSSRRLGLGTLVLLFWLGVPAWLAVQGALAQYSPASPLAMGMIGLLTFGTISLAFSPLGTHVATVTPFAWLVGFQVFRLPVEWVLHRLYVDGIVPVQMTWSGYNFDVLTGISAGLLGLWLVRGGFSRPLVWAWNAMGLVLLMVIVGIAVMSVPGPLRQFSNEPANLLPGIFPYVWLPSFLVQAALFGHIVLFRKLRLGDRR
jgi:hypothetical protein